MTSVKVLFNIAASSSNVDYLNYMSQYFLTKLVCVAVV